ncbi:hypothetical protein [Paenibacillus sp. FSL H8-0537]|uniref:hypothetical protein n=1 Tax=Paenibacillus sp. FSL H8-0537 TaxID=2921399 RepID=UPI003100BAE4
MSNYTVVQEYINKLIRNSEMCNRFESDNEGYRMTFFNGKEEIIFKANHESETINIKIDRKHIDQDIRVNHKVKIQFKGNEIRASIQSMNYDFSNSKATVHNSGKFGEYFYKALKKQIEVAYFNVELLTGNKDIT